MAGGYLFGWLEGEISTRALRGLNLSVHVMLGCCSAKNINPMRDEALQMEENVDDRLRRRSDGVQRIDPAPPKSPHVIQGEAGGSARFSPRVVGTDAEKVGLGIAFQQMVSLHHDSRPKLAVKSLAFDSPAFNSRQIKVVLTTLRASESESRRRRATCCCRSTGGQ
eukprot:163921-Hanusia_phi.AAC.1